MRVPTESVRYVFGLTCERDDDVRVRKLRAMVIREDLLQRIHKGEVAEPAFESPTHHVRWQTLKQMAAHSAEGSPRLMRVQIVPPSTSRSSSASPEGRPTAASAEGAAETETQKVSG